MDPISSTSPAPTPDRTLNARRAARFKFAEDRVRKIVAGAPPLTPDMRDRLAQLLTGDGAP